MVNLTRLARRINRRNFRNQAGGFMNYAAPLASYAYKKYYGKYKKRKTYRKSYKNKLYSSVGNLNCIGLPDTLYTTLKISQGFELKAQANLISTLRCELNNPKDPFGKVKNQKTNYFYFH